MNPIQMFQMLAQKQINPQQILGMLNGNPLFTQAQNMINSGGNPKNIVMNIAKQKGITEQQLKEMAKQKQQAAEAVNPEKFPAGAVKK